MQPGPRPLHTHTFRKFNQMRFKSLRNLCIERLTNVLRSEDRVHLTDRLISPAHTNTMQKPCA